MELTDFVHAGRNAAKFGGLGMVNNGCSQSDDGTQKLTVSEQ